MAADTFSNFIGIKLQGVGNNNNSWGTILNGSALQPLERRISGNIVRAVTGGTLDLSGSPPPAALSQVLDFIQIFQGALTANQIVILPNLSGYWKFVNETTGAFQLLLQTPSGTFVNIPQGCSRGVTCDGAGNLLRDDRDQVGDFVYNSVVKPGTLQCSGQSLLRTDYPDLFATIGATYGSADALHFTLPLLTDTNRFLRAASGSLAVGTYQANLLGAHNHTITGAPSLGTLGTDSQGSHFHTANISDPGHSHSYGYDGGNHVGGGGAFGWDSPLANNTNTGAAATGVRVNSSNGLDTTSSAGAHVHNVTGAPGLGSIANTASGGAETRPEALAVVISIRY
jgi:microcystin-dependent protein